MKTKTLNFIIGGVVGFFFRFVLSVIASEHDQESENFDILPKTKIILNRDSYDTSYDGRLKQPS